MIAVLLNELRLVAWHFEGFAVSEQIISVNSSITYLPSFPCSRIYNLQLDMASSTFRKKFYLNEVK